MTECTLTSRDVYSTDEVKTNKVWIDGKPIYRRTVTGTLPAKGSWRCLPLFDDIPNIDKIWLDAESSFTEQPNVTVKSTDGEFTGTNIAQLNIAGGNAKNVRVFFLSKLNDGSIRYCFYTDLEVWGNLSFTATVEYTKTTD